MSKAHVSIILGLLASNSNPTMHAAVVSRNLQRERVSYIVHLKYSFKYTSPLATRGLRHIVHFFVNLK